MSSTPEPTAASPSPLDVLRGYVERASDWGDAGVGHGAAMDADRDEGMRALDEIQALLEQRRTGSLLARTGNEDAGWVDTGAVEEEWRTTPTDLGGWANRAAEMLAEVKRLQREPRADFDAICTVWELAVKTLAPNQDELRLELVRLQKHAGLMTRPT